MTTLSSLAPGIAGLANATPAGLNAASCISLSALCAGRRIPAVIGRSVRFGSVAATLSVLVLTALAAFNDWDRSRSRRYDGSLAMLRNVIRAAPMQPRRTRQ